MKKLVISVFSILVLLNIVLCFQLWRIKNTQNNPSFENESLEEIRNISLLIFNNSDLSINSFQRIYVENDTSIRFLNDLIIYPKLIYYYNEMSCSPCADKEIQRLDSLSRIIGPENIVLITRTTSAKSLYFLKRANQISFQIAYIDEPINIPIANFPTNFFFILGKDFRTKLLYIPSKLNNTLMDGYLDRVVAFFKESL